MNGNAELTALLSKFGKLFYKSKDNWLPLPDWAISYLELGASFTAFNEQNTRYVVALVLPTRSYAASLIGSGLSLSNILSQVDANKQHLELVSSLPDGTPIKYFDNGKLKKALKRPNMQHNGKLLIGVQIGNGTTLYISEENVNKIEVSNREYSRLPVNQKGRDMNPPSSLLSELLFEKAYEYIFRTELDGMIIGSFNSLSSEAQTELAIQKDKKNICSGLLSDLLRVDGFNQPNSGYRFLTQTPNSNEPASLPSDIRTNIVAVFNGSLSFLKWKERFQTWNWIVILDRTEAAFDNAVAEVNREYSYRSETELKVPQILISNASEMMVFARDI